MYLALMLRTFKQQFAYRASLYIRIIGSIIRVYQNDYWGNRGTVFRVHDSPVVLSEGSS